jgi:hypothetical protein
MEKIKKAKYQADSEFASIDGIKPLKRVVATEEDYNDLIKEYSVERVARKGDNYITQNTSYSVLDLEPDYDFPVYKYIHEGKEYFSNLKFANPIEIINPQTIN